MRSDTFLVRAYGDATNPATDAVEAPPFLSVYFVDIDHFSELDDPLDAAPGERLLLAQALLGQVNPSGHLPLTFYRANDDLLPPTASRGPAKRTSTPMAAASARGKLAPQRQAAGRIAQRQRTRSIWN